MVKTGVTVAGGLLSAVGAGLMVSVALLETFVVVTVPETGTCGDKATPIATIGVYKSSYDPSCAEGTEEYNTKYGLIAPIESSKTLEFPLLFPSQTAYGGALGPVPDEFESCEQTWETGGSLDQASVRAALAGSVFPGVDDNIASTTLELGGQNVSAGDAVNAIAASLIPGVEDLVQSLWTGGVIDTMQKFLDASAGVKDLALGYANGLASAQSSDITTKCPGVFLGNYNTTCGLNPAQFLTVHDKLMELSTLTGVNCTTATDGSLESAACENDGQGIQAAGLYALTNLLSLGATGVSESSPFDAVLGLNSTQLNTTQNWGTTIGYLNAANTIGQLPATLQPARVLLSICDDGTTLASCTDVYTAPSNSNSQDDDALCQLIALDGLNDEPLFATNTATLSGCTFQTALDIFYDQAAGLVSLFAAQFGSDAVTAETLKLIITVPKDCGAGPANGDLAACIGAFGEKATNDFAGLPEDLLASDYLPALLLDAGNPMNLVIGGVATASLATDPSGYAVQQVFTTCLQSGLTTRTACIAGFGPTYDIKIAQEDGADPQKPILKEALVNGASTALLAGAESVEARIAACNDDEKDIEVFETAQMMVPAAIGAAGAGALVSFIAVATKKMPVALVGGILSVIGGGILMGALLYIQSEAPVYKNLEASAEAGEVAGELFYQGGMAQLLALAAVGASVLGGLVTVGSAFCAGAEDETAISAKVDGTY